MDRIGRYEIVRELGRGAMGIVYQAVDPTIGRPVAIKTIRLGEVPDPEERTRLQQRLFREARSAGILSHPGIVTIYDMDDHGELAFIAMEFVDGPTLEQLLSEREALPSDRILGLLRQTAAALDYAHQKGIVHRDIKPANIMVTSTGAAKIADFGIAKVTTSQQFTQAGTLIGTPNYMSPEQVQGLNVDGRADQFSLAVIAYEMLTGAKPFGGDHVTTVVYKIVAEEPVSPHILNPSLGGRIAGALNKALSKKPEARFASCSDFISMLERACAETKGWQPLSRGADLSLPTVAGTQSPPLVVERKKTATMDTVVIPPRNGSRVLPIAVAITVVLGLGVFAAWKFAALNQEVPPPSAAASNAPSPRLPGQADNQKTSPLAPASDSKGNAPAPTDATQAQQHAAGPSAQDVWFSSEPSGAMVVVDGQPDLSCSTPCMVPLAPGKHTAALTLEGFKTENREVQVANSPLTLPTANMRAHDGTLMLTTTPPGATISVNGKNHTEVTPARLILEAGTYTIAVEKDGHKKSESVEIRGGATNYLKIPLE